VNTVEARALVLAGLQAVDYLSIFDEATPLELIEALRPDVLVKGARLSQGAGGRCRLRGILRRPGPSGADARRVFDNPATATPGSGLIASHEDRCVLAKLDRDAVMATPALRALRQRFADARLIGVLKPYVAAVFAGCPC